MTGHSAFRQPGIDLAGEKIAGGGAVRPCRPQGATARSRGLGRAGLMTHALLAGLLLLAGPARAVEPDAAFLGATVRIEESEPSSVGSVRSFLGCLTRFHGSEPAPPLRIEHPSRAIWRVAAMLTTDTIFHFQIVTLDGQPAAVVRRIEYKVGARGYAQITDTAAKHTLVTAVCRTPLPS